MRNRGALSVWRHNCDTVFARYDGDGRPLTGWAPTSLDNDPTPAV